MFSCLICLNILFVRYPSGATPTPPGNFHDSPTEQYWSSLPEQGHHPTGAHPNANPYSANCNINNNLNTSDEYDGMSGGW